MRLRTFLSAAALLSAGLIFTHSASASTLVSIGLQEAGVNGGAISTVQTGSTNATFTGSYGTFTLNNIYGTGNLNTLSSGSYQASDSTGGTITVYITEQGLTSPAGLASLMSGFTSNLFTGAATSVVESTYYDNANGLYTGGTQLASDTFTNVGSGTASSTVNLATPYSETLKFVITTTGAATVNDTISLTGTSVTPEPSSLLLLGTGLVGAASMALRRRKLVA